MFERVLKKGGAVAPVVNFHVVHSEEYHVSGMMLITTNV